MRKNRIKTNFYFKLAYQIVAVLVPLLTTPYLTRTLGATELGNYGYAYSILTYFTIAAVFGFNIYGRREIAKVRDDKTSTSKLFFEIMFSKGITSVISIVAFVFLSIFYREYTILLLSLMPFLVYNLIDITFLIQGDENFQFVTIRDLMVKTISIVLIFVLVKQPDDVWVYAVILSSTSFLSMVAMYPYLKKRIERVPLKGLKVLYHLKKSSTFLIPVFATSVFLYIDKIMIKLITGSSEQVAFYEEAIKIITMLTGITTALANVIEPRNANEFAKGNLVAVKENTTKGINFSILICLPIAVGIAVIAPVFCPIFFGPGFDPVIPILQIMSCLVPVLSLNELLGTTYLIPCNKEKVYSRIILIGTLVNVLTNILFIYLFGCLGAAICTVFSEIVKFAIIDTYLRKEFGFIGIVKNNFKKIVAIIIMFLLIFPISFLSNGSIRSLIGIVLIGMLSFAVAIVCFKDKEFDYLVTVCRLRISKTINSISAKINKGKKK